MTDRQKLAAIIAGAVLVLGVSLLVLNKSTTRRSVREQPSEKVAASPAGPVGDLDVQPQRAHDPSGQQAVEPAHGKVRGAAWTVKNDGTSNIMRGLSVVVVERETTDIPKLIATLKKMRDGWKKWATSSVEDAADRATEAAKVRAIQATIDKVAGRESIDRLLALELEKQALISETLLSPGIHTRNIEAIPEVIAGGGPSGADFGSAKTNVDGKFMIEKVRPGDYYLVSTFRSDALVIEWIVPIHVDANKETICDLDNNNAAYIEQNQKIISAANGQ